MSLTDPDARNRRIGAALEPIAWVLAGSAVDGAIVGFRGPDQVAPIIPAANLHLTAEDIAEIEGR